MQNNTLIHFVNLTIAHQVIKGFKCPRLTELSKTYPDVNPTEKL